jgi:hypothetical protein
VCLGEDFRTGEGLGVHALFTVWGGSDQGKRIFFTWVPMRVIMGSVYECFLLRPTNKYRVNLRRYSNSSMCPTNNWCHNADVFIGVEEHSTRPVSGDSEGLPHDDDRWPQKCDQCAYRFLEADYWQVNFDNIYAAVDGREFTLISSDQMTNDKTMMAPPGALWECDWMPGKGPDGKSYCVRTPGGDWHIDGTYSHGRWTRTGTAPNFTVMPSILIGKKSDGSWQYHGWFRRGRLVEV